MTPFTDLVFNPVTIIATLLALFFVLMAVRRRRHAAPPSSRPKTDTSDKPYRVVNPYRPPTLPDASAPDPAPRDTLTSPDAPPPTRRVFRQFGQSALHPEMKLPNEKTGYIWE